MGKVKQLVKPYYYAYKSTFVYSLFNVVLNLFFRHNNLFSALVRAHFFGNKIVIGKNVVLHHCKFEIHGHMNIILIAEDCYLSGLRIYMNSGINELTIGRGTIVNASKNQRTLFNPCEGGKIIIGEKCLFSNNIELHTTDYHKIFSNSQRTNLPKSIIIGKHCWIGLQSLLLKGTILPDNTIVGARSILNKKFDEDNAVLVGNPAKVVKRDVAWDY